MNGEAILRMVSDLLWTGLVVCAPVLGLTMAVGFLVSLLQVVTQVQENSLTFVPKLLTAVVSLIVLGPWMLRKLIQFSAHLWSEIPSMI